MIIRETKIIECWCPTCNNGQMQQILQKSFEEHKQLQDYIGQLFTCNHCKTENVIEDILSIIPEGFLVMSNKDASKWKSNQDLKNFLES